MASIALAIGAIAELQPVLVPFSEGKKLRSVLTLQGENEAARRFGLAEQAVGRHGANSFAIDSDPGVPLIRRPFEVLELDLALDGSTAAIAHPLGRPRLEPRCSPHEDRWPRAAP